MEDYILTSQEWKAFQESDPWKEVTAIIEERIRQYMRVLETGLVPGEKGNIILDYTSLRFIQGECKGLRFVNDTLMKNYEDLLKERENKLNEEKDNANTDS